MRVTFTIDNQSFPADDLENHRSPGSVTAMAARVRDELRRARCASHPTGHDRVDVKAILSFDGPYPTITGACCERFAQELVGVVKKHGVWPT